MITWEDIVKSIEAGISNIDELFSVGVPTELGEDQKVTLTEPPLVPQSNTTSAPDIVAAVNTVLGQPDNNERNDEMNWRIDNELNQGLADAKPYGYTPDLIQPLVERWQYNLETNSPSVVSADYMVSPCSDVYGDSPVTEEEKRAGIHLNENGIKVDVAGNPLPEEIDKIDYRNRVTIQSLYDELGNIIEGLQSYRENQDNESAKEMAKGILVLEKVTPDDPQYEAKLQEKINMWIESQNSVVPGGMKFVRGLNGIIKGSSKAWGSTEHLVKSAMESAKGNNTAIGRAFQKHAVRDGSAFTGEITGNATRNTEQGMEHLNRILNDPNATFVVRDTKAFGKVLDVRLPDGTGARWSDDGKTFIGLLERFTPK